MIDTAENTAENISPDMHALACAINALPGEQRAALAPLLNKVLNAAASRRILALVQDALGQLRLDMQYLVFDNEATRRERDEYRRKLEGSVDFR